ncbi:MAG: asparagine synthase-related protein [Dehalococcoidia bacterium]
MRYDPAGFVDDLRSVVWHMDSPHYSAQVVARWSLLKAAGAEVKVVLEGQGADEMLAGYPWRHTRPYLRDLAAATRPWNLPWNAARAAGAVRQGQPLVTASRRLLAMRRREAQPPARLLSREAAAAARANPLPRLGPSPFEGHLRAALWRDHSSLMLPALLHFGDAISMAHSVESRVPFLDHRLVEFGFQQPFQALARGGETKAILRDGLRRDLPPSTLARRDKVGFRTPAADWLRASLPAVKDVLAERQARTPGLFDQAVLDRALGNGRTGGHLAANRLFRCLSLAIWFEQFIDGPTSAGSGPAR